MPTNWHPAATWLIAGTLLLILLIVGRYFNLWLQARFSDAAVPFLSILRLRLRGLDAKTIVLSHIRLVKAGLERPFGDLEAHAKAGGRLPTVVRGMIAAAHAGVALTWAEACAMDLKGQDVVAFVESQARQRGQTANAAN